MAVANLISRYRFEHAEMTQQRLADLSGGEPPDGNALERNKVSPSLEVAFKIARVFSASFEDFFLFEGGPEGGDLLEDGAIIEMTFENTSGARTEGETLPLTFHPVPDIA